MVKLNIKITLTFLKKTIEIAKELDTHLIRCFAFSKKEQIYEKNILDEVVKQFAEPTRIAESGGVIIAIENDSKTFAETGRELSHLLKLIGSKTIQALWDPANAFSDGETPSSGYEKIKDLMVHLHVKDILVKGRTLEGDTFAPVGEGKINWTKLIEALLKNKYEGCASFETSYRMRQGEKAGEDATRKSYNNCLRILDKLSDGKVIIII
jgi:sugar phosphate isomerase/epimerase